MALTPDYLSEEEDVAVETREIFPSHFLFKVPSISKIWEYGIYKYETPVFVAGGYKWSLVIYPNGRDKGNKSDHISVHLAMADTTCLAERWEVYAVFSIFLHNQKLDNFIATKGITRRFHAMNPERGFSKYISKKSLTDPSNGYVVDDNCVFGAEVFVIKSQGLSVLKDKQEPYKRSFIISNFSKLPNLWLTEKFVAGNQTWTIQVYPKGDSKGMVSGDMSMYLKLADDKPREVKVNYTLGIKNQYTGERYTKTNNNTWFTHACTGSWGWASFMPLKDLNDSSKGYIVGDCCIVEIELMLQAIAYDLV